MIGMSPFATLLVVLIIVSTFSFLGVFVAYVALPKVKANEKLWELFASYLMILLAADLAAVQLIRRIVTELDISYFIKGFLMGMSIVFVCMYVYSFIKGKKRAHSHRGTGISIFTFLILAIHEVTEGASVAELLYEVSVTSISITAPLFPIIVLALHEFPEGLLLVTPFFIEKKIKSGIYASLINQALFIFSGVIIYRYVLIFFEPNIGQEAFISMLPVGGIFFLGLHELKNSLEHRDDLKLFYTDAKLKLISLTTFLVILGSLYLVYNHTRKEKAGEVSEIDCEQGIDLGECLNH